MAEVQSLQNENAQLRAKLGECGAIIHVSARRGDTGACKGCVERASLPPAHGWTPVPRERRARPPAEARTLTTPPLSSPAPAGAPRTTPVRRRVVAAPVREQSRRQAPHRAGWRQRGARRATTRRAAGLRRRTLASPVGGRCAAENAGRARQLVGEPRAPGGQWCTQRAAGRGGAAVSQAYEAGG